MNMSLHDVFIGNCTLCRKKKILVMTSAYDGGKKNKLIECLCATCLARLSLRLATSTLQIIPIHQRKGSIR